MADKRDECGCHKGCEIEPHGCDNPCMWPLCLSGDEMRDLLDEMKDV